MCLFANRKYSLTAREDIECYKVLRRAGDILTSYFHERFTWEKSITYTTLLQTFNSVFREYQCNVEQGFHSYMYQKDAEAFINEVCGDETLVLVKCIIPKGSQYFVGDSTDWRAGYASDKIIFTSIVKEYKHKVEIHSVADEDPFDLDSLIPHTIAQQIISKPICLNIDVIPNTKPNKVKSWGSKYIAPALLFLTTLTGISACTIRQSPDEIEKFRIENRQLSQSEFENDGHKYKVFTVFNNKYISVVHDPDCNCHNR